jgi:ribosome-binding protein aMBF1 (putative translation factor)
MKMNEKDKNREATRALEALRLVAAQCGNAKVRSENLKIVKDYMTTIFNERGTMGWSSENFLEELHEREAALLRNAEAEDMEEEMQNDK